MGVLLKFGLIAVAASGVGSFGVITLRSIRCGLTMPVGFQDLRRPRAVR